MLALNGSKFCIHNLSNTKVICKNMRMTEIFVFLEFLRIRFLGAITCVLVELFQLFFPILKKEYVARKFRINLLNLFNQIPKLS